MVSSDSSIKSIFAGKNSCWRSRFETQVVAPEIITILCKERCRWRIWFSTKHRHTQPEISLTISDSFQSISRYIELYHYMSPNWTFRQAGVDIICAQGAKNETCEGNEMVGSSCKRSCFYCWFAKVPPNQWIKEVFGQILYIQKYGLIRLPESFLKWPPWYHMFQRWLNIPSSLSEEYDCWCLGISIYIHILSQSTCWFFTKSTMVNHQYFTMIRGICFTFSKHPTSKSKLVLSIWIITLGFHHH